MSRFPLRLYHLPWAVWLVAWPVAGRYALLAVTVAVWAAGVTWAAYRGRAIPRGFGPWPVVLPLLALPFWALLSALWAPVPDLALAQGRILAAMGLLLLFLLHGARPWAWTVGWLTAGLAAQTLLGVFQFARGWANGGWSALDPFLRPGLNNYVLGAVVVQSEDGTRYLRALGTLTHPNVLGGFLVLGLCALAGLYAASRRWWLRALAVGGLGWLTIGLALTFSRSAWLGAAAAALLAGLLELWRARARWAELGPRLRRALPAILVVLLVAGGLLWLLRDLLGPRTGVVDVPLEERSIGERGLTQEYALGVIASHPLGVGAGNYPVVAAERNFTDSYLRWAHNTPLLITAEIGWPGAALLLGALLGIAVITGRIGRQAGPWPATWAVALAGLLTAGLFDHYLWTWSAAQPLLWAALGLWANSVRDHWRAPRAAAAPKEVLTSPPGGYPAPLAIGEGSL